MPAVGHAQELEGNPDLPLQNEEPPTSYQGTFSCHPSCPPVPQLENSALGTCTSNPKESRFCPHTSTGRKGGRVTSRRGGSQLWKAGALKPNKSLMYTLQYSLSPAPLLLSFRLFLSFLSFSFSAPPLLFSSLPSFSHSLWRPPVPGTGTQE